MSTPIPPVETPTTPPAQAPPPADATGTLLKELVNSAVQLHVSDALGTITTQATEQAAAAVNDTVDLLHQESLEAIKTAHDESLALIGQARTTANTALGQITTDLVPRLEALEARAIPALGAIGGVLVQNAMTNKVTQHWLIVMIAGSALIGALSILIADLAGSHNAADIVAGAPALFAAAFGLVLAHAKGLIPTPNDTTQPNGQNSIAGAPVR